jgi:D-alanyl-D-alanine carboxypeptidase
LKVKNPNSLLEALIGRETPGLQYLALNAGAPVFEFCGGPADIGARRAMDAATTLNAYSMSKTITAAAVLRLVQAGALSLDDTIGRFFPDGCPFDGAITIRQLMTHTAGIPNPIPLRWVHLAERHAGFDEGAALQRVLRKNPKLAAAPGVLSKNSSRSRCWSRCPLRLVKCHFRLQIPRGTRKVI